MYPGSPAGPPHGGRPYGGPPHQPHHLPPPRSPAPADPARGARVRWIAITPPGTQGLPPEPAEGPYTGPPSYPAPPRWGFPSLVWRWPTTVPGTPSAAADPAERQRSLGRNALMVLIATATLALLSSVAELWRYVLLVQSREQPLNSGVVFTSDAFVLTTTLLTFAAGAFAVLMTYWWGGMARTAAARRAGVRPPREPWRVAVAVFVPLLNLVLAGQVLAELEHTVLRRPADQRPRPSRLVLAWWAAWVANGILLILTVIWRMRDGVQAQADGVLLNAATNLGAAALAVLTGLFVYRMTTLLAPVVPRRLRRLRVLAVRGAPAPALRAERPVGARR